MNDFVRCKRLNEAFSYVSDEYLDLVELERKPERMLMYGKEASNRKQ